MDGLRRSDAGGQEVGQLAREDRAGWDPVGLRDGLPHARLKDGTTMDGKLFRDPNDPTEAEAIVVITAPVIDPATKKLLGTITSSGDVLLHVQEAGTARG